MNNPFFTKDGHIARWVFFPPAWGGEDYWAEGFTDEEKTALFNHMKVCHACREAEIESTLHWAELRPREKRVELLQTTPAITSPGEPVNNLAFDKYPMYLLDHISQFIRGTTISFDRDKTGRVEKISGVIDGEIESDVRFIYDGSTTTIHCYCHNCEDDPVSTLDRLTFADFHINHTKETLITYSLDVTEFVPECKEIKRYHTYHKIFTDNQGNISKILQDNKPWYSAEYDNGKKIIRKNHGPLTTEYQYTNDQLIHKKCINTDDVIEQIVFEYAENQPGPVRVFDKKDSGLRLKALHSYSTAVNEQIHVAVEPDGVARYYYDNIGKLFLKVQLPYRKEQLNKKVKLTHLEELLDKSETVEMFLVDNSTGSMRIIQKKEGATIIDQASFFENGLIAKVCNHTDAECCTLLSLHFINHHWTEIIEIDDPSL